MTVWRPSVCLSRRHTHRDSPGASMRHGQPTFRPDNKENRYTCFHDSCLVIFSHFSILVFTTAAWWFLVIFPLLWRGMISMICSQNIEKLSTTPSLRCHRTWENYIMSLQFYTFACYNFDRQEPNLMFFGIQCCWESKQWKFPSSSN